MFYGGYMRVFLMKNKFYVTAEIEELDSLFEVVSFFDNGSNLTLCGEELDINWGFPLDRLPHGLGELIGKADRFNTTCDDPTEAVKVLNYLLEKYK